MSESIQYIDAAAYGREVLEAEGPVVVDFYSDECPPCEALAAKYEGLAALYGHDVKFIKVFRQKNRELAEKLGVRSSPTVLFYDEGKRVGDVLTGGVKRAALVKNLELLIAPARAAELRASTPKTTTDTDVLILGAGPAGLTAAIYTAQAKLRTVVVDRALAGGNVAITHQVSNFPGFAKPKHGHELAAEMQAQAQGAGAVLRLAADLTKIDLAAKTVELDGSETIRAKKVIVATGSSPRPVGARGEVEYRGKGLSYCATCDAKYYEGKHVVVIGGGNSAIGESLFISRFASKITVVHQFDKLQANKELQERAFADPKISFLYSHEPREFVAGDGTVRAVVTENLKTKQPETIECDGVFVFVGMMANLEGISGLELDPWGYVKAGEDMHTSQGDVFVAGDVRSKAQRQITTAVSDGTIAAMVIAKEMGA